MTEPTTTVTRPVRHTVLTAVIRAMCAALGHPTRHVQRENTSTRAACPCGMINYSDVRFVVSPQTRVSVSTQPVFHLALKGGTHACPAEYAGLWSTPDVRGVTCRACLRIVAADQAAARARAEHPDLPTGNCSGGGGTHGPHVVDHPELGRFLCVGSVGV